ncbi:MAG: PDZ domain-containing protein [Desulfobacterales bacterium]|nr:PDZ domain-containing protein [Desulfobacterales bacterium]
MNKMIWFAPISVVLFLIFLAVMYGWIDEIEPVKVQEKEIVEAKPANNVQTFPAGIGNNNIQLINNPTFPAGIGNSQIQLINQNQTQTQVETATYLGLNLSENLYVQSAIPSSPAEKAGIKSGDLIFSFDHKNITTREQISTILQTKKPGDTVKVVVSRDKTKKSFQVTLEQSFHNIKQIAAIQSNRPNWMGADIQDIDSVMKAQFNLPDKQGVIISYVSPNSPAEKSGLSSGDVIRRFSGTRIRDVKQLQKLIIDSPAGNQIQLTIFRGGEYQTIPVVLGQQPQIADKPPLLGPADLAIEGSWIGMDITELSPETATGMGLPSGTQGILVSDVESPPATMVGFQTNDIIVAINGISTPDMKQFAKATENQSNAVVDIIRGNRHFFITVPTPGFTQQGTKINTPMDNKMKQVASNSSIKKSVVAIFTEGANVNSQVGGDMANSLIIADLDKNSYTVVGASPDNSITQIMDKYNIDAVICGNISKQRTAALLASNISIYSGVTGTVLQAIALFEANLLVSMKY